MNGVGHSRACLFFPEGLHGLILRRRGYESVGILPEAVPEASRSCDRALSTSPQGAEHLAGTWRRRSSTKRCGGSPILSRGRPSRSSHRDKAERYTQAIFVGLRARTRPSWHIHGISMSGDAVKKNARRDGMPKPDGRVTGNESKERRLHMANRPAADHGD